MLLCTGHYGKLDAHCTRLSVSAWPCLGNAAQEFGKHGYIREGDMHLKEGEFRLWAGEVKGANVELLGRAEERELFKEYMEDYNTGTLKHRHVALAPVVSRCHHCCCFCACACACACAACVSDALAPAGMPLCRPQQPVPPRVCAAQKILRPGRLDTVPGTEGSLQERQGCRRQGRWR